jgi:hypothetical protein
MVRHILGTVQDEKLGGELGMGLQKYTDSWDVTENQDRNVIHYRTLSGLAY